MAKKSVEPMVTICRMCPICKKHFIVPHPKDTKPFCDDCIAVIRGMVMEKRGQNNECEASM